MDHTQPEAAVARAERIARAAHEGQTDKAGEPYWTHPSRVARRVRELYPGASDHAVAAAWLHDVIEDTDWTAERLYADGFPLDVVIAVVALTRIDPAEEPQIDAASYDYYAGIRAAGEIALQVKHADITDNLDEDRLAKLDPESQARLRAKYANALGKLGLPEPA